MNKKFMQSIVNEYKRHIDMGNKFGSHENCVRISPANSLEHEKKKLEICYELAQQGIPFMTEVIFEGRHGRGDIVDLYNGIIFEVVKSESKESIEEKKKKYPDCFEVKVVRV